MSEKNQRARDGVLRAVAEAGRPVGAQQLATSLAAMGISLQPRSIRHYLLELDREGLTRLVSRRRGREITEKGRLEVADRQAGVRMQVISTKTETLGYRMTFDIHAGIGTVIINVSYVDPADFAKAIREIQLAANEGFGIGTKVAVMEAGTTLGEQLVPEGTIGIGTICSMTLNGILRKEGIPVHSRFCGLLEIRERRITGFQNMIEYDGCTLDPIGIFMRAGMMSVREVVLRGSGVICVSFREVPAVARPQIAQAERLLRRKGLGGILALGKPNQPLFGVPVSEGHCAMIIPGGMNPIASATEAGVRLAFRSLAGLEDIGGFVTAREAVRRFG